MWLGVINETRGGLSPEVLDIFDHVDFILHCGNIGSPEVLDSLSYRAPTSGILGPADDPQLFDGVLKTTLLKSWSEIGVLVVREIGDPLSLLPEVEKLIAESAPELVLFGEPAIAHNSRAKNRLFFNPGAATPARGRGSVGLVEFSGKSLRAEVVPLSG